MDKQLKPSNAGSKNFGQHQPNKRHSAPAVQPASSVMPSSGIQLKRLIGNKAVTHMMSQRQTTPSTPANQPVIQRKIVAQFSNTLKRNATTEDLMQAFNRIGMRSQILSAKEKLGIDLATFMAVLQQEIDENNVTLHLASNTWGQSKDEIGHIASNVLQKLYLDPSVSKEDGETDIFYDMLEEDTSKEELLPRLEKLKEQMLIFPEGMKAKLMHYYSMVTLSKQDAPLSIDIAPIEQMELYMLDFSKDILDQVKTLDSRIKQDAFLIEHAPQLQDYLATFLYINAEDLSAFSIKKLADNLALLSRRIGFINEELNAAPKPEVYIHKNATDEALDRYVTMVHNNWNAGRNNPTRDTPAKHTHVEGYSVSMIFSMQNASNDLYIHGVVGFHMDSGMSSSESKSAAGIEDRHQTLANFIPYMSSGSTWITKEQWYQNKIAQYLSFDLE
jgi:hypothetical protein